MEKICNTKVELPQLLDEPCNGNYTSTNCVFTAKRFQYLGLDVNSTITDVISNLILALQYKDTQIENLQQQINALNDV